MRIDYNECGYSPDANDPHSACLHPAYCIFNQNRVRLESMISELENDLESVEFQLSCFHEIYTTTDYDELKKEKTLLMNDLEELKTFRSTIIDREIRKYGYGVLES